MSLSPSDLRRALTRATQTHADLLTLRTSLARVLEALTELDTHPEDEAIVWSVRARLDGPSGLALDDLDALISREQAREVEAWAAVDAAEREEQASEDRDAGPVALTA